MKKRILLVAVILLVVSGVLSIGQAYVYDVVSLGNFGGFLGSSPVQGFATAINESGQIVGTSYDTSGNARAFIWQNGIMRDLGTLGGSSAQARDINNSGQVVGWSYDTTGNPRAYMWQNGAITNLGISSGTESYARSINDSGNIVGNIYYDYSRGGIDVFLWSNGQTSNLGSGWANAINNSNQVLIYSSYIWENGVRTPLNINGQVNGYDSSMNNQGQVVLQINDQAAIWQQGNVIQIGTLGGDWSRANSINNKGVVVGASNYERFGSDRAFIYKDGEIYDLNGLIPSSSGWTIIDAMDINEKGQIAAYAINYSKYKAGAVLLNPVPTPSAILLLGSGLAGIIGFKKLRLNQCG